jgi:nitroimidazol reductase NimA-like FMN-containing flavoprotein (pyridoxamine 5'-phosphate oxidase superfamily)
MRERGSYERSALEEILDEGLVCHVAFSSGGSTFVLPTTYARVDGNVYLHGASGNHMLRQLSSGVQACLCVTLLDGLVFARSAFHHSMNYRSVVLFGSAELVEEPAEKRTALLAIVDHMAPGRSCDARPPTDKELTTTLVVRFPLDEASAKVRSGGPKDDEEDVGLPVWAGELPLETIPAAPVPADDLPPGTGTPRYVSDYLAVRVRPQRPLPAL